nr:hypothetical protein [Tanacetum cinerariifolium]
MLQLRPFKSLGGADHGWLNAHHHFSFANYYDPSRMSWGQLRVWNDDVIEAGTGFPRHPHRDMEIITYAGETAEYALDEGRRAYLVPATGLIEVNGVRAEARDGVAAEDERVLRVTAIEDSEITPPIATWVQAERRSRSLGRAAWMPREPPPAMDGGGPTERDRSEETPTKEGPNQEQAPLVTWGWCDFRLFPSNSPKAKQVCR